MAKNFWKKESRNYHAAEEEEEEDDKRCRPVKLTMAAS